MNFVKQNGELYHDLQARYGDMSGIAPGGEQLVAWRLHHPVTIYTLFFRSTTPFAVPAPFVSQLRASLFGPTASGGVAKSCTLERWPGSAAS